VHPDGGAEHALAALILERKTAGIDRLDTELALAPAGFLSGQETALINAVNGGPGLPTFTPPPVYERGAGGRPTLVQNVETLAHLALIARYGAGWFRAAGTAAEPGSMLASVWQADGRRGIAETELGTPMGELVAFGGQTRAVLIGGYHGCWLPADRAEQLWLCNASLRPAGASVGAGVIAALPAGCCGLAETARVARYLALESAGQCGPCLNGLPRIATALAELAGPRPGGRVIADLERWAGLVTGRGACHHPDGTVRFVGSALTVFAGEIRAHTAGHCTALTRQPFLPVPAGQPGAAARGGRR
jgi:NADH:ubiquinone oxidoreductase subunit F (NADH-binding)